VSDPALAKFGLFLVSALAVMLILTIVFRRTEFFFGTKITDWLGAVFTLALAGFTYELTHIASRQTEIMSHTDIALNLAASAESASAQTAEKLRLFTEATERAWISASDIGVSGVKWNEENEGGADAARLQVWVNLKNTGRSPALSVELQAIAYAGLDLPPLLTKQQALSQSARSIRARIGNMVFPGDSTQMGINIPITREDVEHWRKENEESFGHTVTSVPTWVLIIIDYRVAERNEHHQTGYIMQFNRSLPIGVDNVPAEYLSLHYNDYGQYAD
jgi:hypothetical protein